MERKPKVSIVTPCYNAAKFIAANIESINSQTYQHWERIFVDDGSKDETALIIKQLIASDDRQHLVSKANEGVSKARNLGFKSVSPESEYVVFFDADDIVNSRYLETLITFLEKRQDFGVVYCGIRFINDLGEDIGPWDWPRYVPTKWWARQLPSNELETPFFSIFAWTAMGESVPLLRKRVFEQYGPWDTNLFYGEGVDLYSRIALKEKIARIPDEYYYYRRHVNQATHTVDFHKEELDRLDSKWKAIADTDPASKGIITSAFVFRDFRKNAFLEWKQIFKSLSAGKIKKAAIHTFRFIKLYTSSL